MVLLLDGLAAMVLTVNKWNRNEGCYHPGIPEVNKVFEVVEFQDVIFCWSSTEPAAFYYTSNEQRFGLGTNACSINRHARRWTGAS